MDLIDKYLGEGKLSWSEVDKIAKQNSGVYDNPKDKEKGQYWNVYKFKSKDDYTKFAKELQKSHMTMKGDIKDFKMKVWF